HEVMIEQSFAHHLDGALAGDSNGLANISQVVADEVQNAIGLVDRALDLSDEVETILCDITVVEPQTSYPTEILGAGVSSCLALGEDVAEAYPGEYVVADVTQSVNEEVSNTNLDFAQGQITRDEALVPVQTVTMQDASASFDQGTLEVMMTEGYLHFLPGAEAQVGTGEINISEIGSNNDEVISIVGAKAVGEVASWTDEAVTKTFEIDFTNTVLKSENDLIVGKSSMAACLDIGADSVEMGIGYGKCELSSSASEVIGANFGTYDSVLNTFRSSTAINELVAPDVYEQPTLETALEAAHWAGVNLDSATNYVLADISHVVPDTTIISLSTSANSTTYMVVELDDNLASEVQADTAAEVMIVTDQEADYNTAQAYVNNQGNIEIILNNTTTQESLTVIVETTVPAEFLSSVVESAAMSFTEVIELGGATITFLEDPNALGTVLVIITDANGNIITQGTFNPGQTLTSGVNAYVRGANVPVQGIGAPGLSPLTAAVVKAYDKTDSCAAQYETGGDFEGMEANCTPANVCSTAATGKCTVFLNPGEYRVLATSDLFPGMLSRNANTALVEENLFEKKNYMFITTPDGDKKPGKSKKHKGSELWVTEPAYAVWDGTQEFYPFVYESDSDWTIDICLNAPEGYAPADGVGCQQAVVSNEAKSVNFVLITTTAEARKVPDTAKITLKLKNPQGKYKKITSYVESRLSPGLAKKLGVKVDKHGRQLDNRGQLKKAPKDKEENINAAGFLEKAALPAQAPSPEVFEPVPEPAPVVSPKPTPTPAPVVAPAPMPEPTPEPVVTPPARRAPTPRVAPTPTPQPVPAPVVNRAMPQEKPGVFKRMWRWFSGMFD
ncbi:hypothetical protein ACFLZY_03545, partial [Patescibacteria group bacterium]